MMSTLMPRATKAAKAMRSPLQDMAQERQLAQI
jgi:hypothetical protein